LPIWKSAPASDRHGKFKERKARIFRLLALGASFAGAGLECDERHTPDPMLIASEGALWGAIHHQGYCPIP